MSSFTSPLEYKSIPKSNLKEITKGFRYFPIDKHVGPYITVPQGFKYDGASIPRFLWPIVGHPWSGYYDQAAAVHDLLYRNVGWVVIWEDHVGLDAYDIDRIIHISLISPVMLIQFSRDAVDKLFYEACEVLGTPKHKALTLYSGVKAFGWHAWNRHKAEWLKKKQCPLYLLNKLGYTPQQVL